jgi:hypothetical protein
MRCDTFYVLINNENYEFLDQDGYTTDNLLSAERFDGVEEAGEEQLSLDEPSKYDVVRVTSQYNLQKIS